MPAGSYESMADDIALHGFDDGVEKDGDHAANRADQQRKQEKFLIIRQTETVEEVRRPQLLLRLLLVRECLCEGCNLEFRAFALRPAKSRGVRMRRKANRFNQAPAVDLSLLNQAAPKVKPAATPTFNFDPAMMTPPAQM